MYKLGNVLCTCVGEGMSMLLSPVIVMVGCVDDDDDGGLEDFFFSLPSREKTDVFNWKVPWVLSEIK